jgi:electron transfer flavoprotein alpha subunit
VAGAVALPQLDGGFVVKKSVFSGKAFAHVAVQTPIRIIALMPNAFGVAKTGSLAEVVTQSIQASAPSVKLVSVARVTGTVPLAEADLVVSGGRGLKGPENWHLVEDLAKEIGAATACSRAVADAHWRPHHEHVGQTGGAVAPNLYFAIGISGAIQHLAGVNRSKTIVVINKDPEAPFFKAADYGIVGDAFEVMPKVLEAVRRLKANA